MIQMENEKTYKQRETIIVNLFGVPSSGKSTGSAYVFSKLKMKNINAELITEFAKDKVWEENAEVFKNQAYIFGKQSYRISRVNGKVDVIITDSPLLLSAFYNNDPVLGDSFNETVCKVFKSYNTLNYLLLRAKPYNPVGRHQTEEEADALREPLVELLDGFEIDYKVLNGNLYGYDEIVNDILYRLDN